MPHPATRIYYVSVTPFSAPHWHLERMILRLYGVGCANENYRRDPFMSITVYGWRIRDKRTGRWRKLCWQMTEQDASKWAAKEGVEIEKIEGSSEVRHPILDGWGGSVPATPGKR